MSVVLVNSYIYIIVASSSWHDPVIRYRRHRFAKYLKKQNDTEEVVWIYPVRASPSVSGSYGRAKHEIEDRLAAGLNEDGIQEYALPDYIPLRLMLYQSGFCFQQFKELKRNLQKYNGKKVVLFTHPVYPYLASLLQWDKIVYDCSDLWIEPSDDKSIIKKSTLISKKLLGMAEKGIIHSSDLIFTSSDYLTYRIASRYGKKALTIENGVDKYFFNQKNFFTEDPMVNIKRPRLGYVGALRGKNDLPLLSELANSYPEYSIVLVGPDCINERDIFKALLEKTNVYWLDAVQPVDVPSYIRYLDVGLLPYREIEYNKGVFPIKFYEYLSQGIPIIGCGLPSTEKYSEEGIYIHTKREGFINACEKALSWTMGKYGNYLFKRISLAREASWDDKFSTMLAKIREGV